MKTVFSMLLAATLITSLTAYANTINTDEAISPNVTEASQVQASNPTASTPAADAAGLQDL
jgi:hypothetical protein